MSTDKKCTDLMLNLIMVNGTCWISETLITINHNVVVYKQVSVMTRIIM